MKKRAIKEQGTRRRKIAIGVAFKFLNVGGRKARNRKGVSQARHARKETVRIEQKVESS